MDQVAGSRCLARPGGGDWEKATIRRVNEDGTFTIEPDVKPMIIMPFYYGVTPGEVASGEAAAAAPAPAGEPAYFRLYWNQTRMGGRQPSELPRPVTLDDALTALGLGGAGADAQARAAIAAFEAHSGVALPAQLAALLSTAGFADAVRTTHPNNPELLAPGDEWELQRDGSTLGLDGSLVLPIMQPHQGDHRWAAVFQPGDADARIYITWTSGEPPVQQFLLTAPTSAMFFWDLAQTGLAWYQETGHRGGKPVTRTDLGLALVRP